jgi:hypothetical protein
MDTKQITCGDNWGIYSFVSSSAMLSVTQSKKVNCGEWDHRTNSTWFWQSSLSASLAARCYHVQWYSHRQRAGFREILRRIWGFIETILFCSWCLRISKTTGSFDIYLQFRQPCGTELQFLAIVREVQAYSHILNAKPSINELSVTTVIVMQ